MSERYAAFISYSHADESVARWLHRGIEGYRFPKQLRGEPTEFGPVPARLPPVFRDRVELPASGDLGSELRAALAAARFQIVLCSPRAAQSKWVNEEILSFKRTHGEHRTLALIVAGEPYSGGAEECFPEALRFKLGPDGELSDQPAEPIAADIRPGKDGKRLALLKLLAGISGTRLDQLARRDAARRQRRLVFVAAGSSAVALVTIGLAIYAETQRRVAVEQREMAESSLEFLTGTFEIANPAKENPRTITALTILDRASKRAEQEFADRPAIAASLLRTTGQIYMNLGLPEQSERDLKKALAREGDDSEGRVQTLLSLASLARKKNDADLMEKWVEAASQVLQSEGSGADRLNALLHQERAQIVYLRAQYSRSAEHFARVAQEFANLPGDNRADVARIQTMEAASRLQMGEVASATALFANAAATTRDLYGDGDVRTALALQNTAAAQLENAQPDTAAITIQGALAIFTSVVEPDHPLLMDAYLLDGRIKSSTENFAESGQSFARARSIATKLYGRNSSIVGDIDFFTAEMLGSAGQTTQALHITENVKRIYDMNYGAMDPDQAELLLLRGRIFADANRLDDARGNCLKALSLQKKLKTNPEIVGQTRSICDDYIEMSQLR